MFYLDKAKCSPINIQCKKFYIKLNVRTKGRAKSSIFLRQNFLSTYRASDMKEQVGLSLSLSVCVYVRKVFSPNCGVYMLGCIDTFILPLSDVREGAKQLLCFVF